MKKLLLTAILIASSPSYAGMCENLGVYAEKVMQFRQEGGKFSSAKQDAKGVGMLQAVVDSAYARPRYKSEKRKKQSIQDFSIKVEKMCYDAFRG